MQRKIIDFPLVASSDDLQTCELCRAPKKTTSLCAACASGLINVALSSIAEDDSKYRVEEAFCGLDIFQRHYDHFEVSLTPEGLPWELGRGSMGITYRAVDTHLDRLVALKVINTHRLAGPAARTRLLQEARTAARLRHTNIASVFHLGLDDTNCYYAMEYIEGETLEAYVCRQGPLPSKIALDIIAQCAAALKVAHQHHFIHRDIKPTNVMLLQAGQTPGGAPLAKLIDFGLVKVMADEDIPSNDVLLRAYFAGTPHYASPENLAAGMVDARSDIYSLGRCLWFMLSGEAPHPNRTSTVDGGRHSQTAAPPLALPSSIPKNLAALLAAMVAADPASRLQSADHVLEGIRVCLEEMGCRDQSSVRRIRKQRWILSTMVVVGVVALLATIMRVPQTSSRFLATHVIATQLMQDARLLCAQADEHFFKQTQVDNEQAIRLYSRAIEAAPEFPDAYAGLAYAQFQAVWRFGAERERLETAVTNAQKAISIDPKGPRGYTALGTIRGLQGRHWEALQQIRRALEVNPEYTPAMRDFATGWCFVGQPERGLPWALEATRREPTNNSGWIAAANACIELCEDEQAERCYKQCLEISPAWMPAHCGLIHLHLLQGNFAQASNAYDLAESIHPDLILPLTLKAQIHLFSGDNQTAEILYRRLLKMYRHGSVDYFGGISYLSALGFLRQKAGDTVEANQLLNEAAKMHLSDREGPQGMYDLAAVRCVQGRGQEALTLLQQAISSGWMDYRTAHLDPRFGNLRESASFRAMLDSLKGHVEVMRSAAHKLCAKPLDLSDYCIQADQR